MPQGDTDKNDTIYNAKMAVNFTKRSNMQWHYIKKLYYVTRSTIYMLVSQSAQLLYYATLL